NILSRMADIPDGTSNTLLIAEDAGRPQRWRVNGLRLPGRQGGGGWADRGAAYITHRYTRDGSDYPRPCAVNCTNDNEIHAFPPGGADAVFGDGSVRFPSPTVSIRVIAAVTTRAGGETNTNLDG